MSDLLALLDRHVDCVRHYLHLQIGKPASKNLVSAPEIALDNLHREMKEAVDTRATQSAAPGEGEPVAWQHRIREHEDWSGWTLISKGFHDAIAADKAEGRREDYELRALYAAPIAPSEPVGWREALNKLACWHVTEQPLWWQLEARAALAAPPAPAVGREALEWVRSELFSLCEDTEKQYFDISHDDIEGKEGAFARGRIREARSIRKAMGEVIGERLRLSAQSAQPADASSQSEGAQDDYVMVKRSLTDAELNVLLGRSPNANLTPMFQMFRDFYEKAISAPSKEDSRR